MGHNALVIYQALTIEFQNGLGPLETHGISVISSQVDFSFVGRQVFKASRHLLGVEQRCGA